MAELLDLHASEESTYIVTVSFLDEDSAAVVPDSAEWALQDSAGTVINSRQDVSISGMASSKDIYLSGDDLAFSSSETEDKVLRELSVEYVYDGATTDNLPGTCSIFFWLDRVGRYKVV